MALLELDNIQFNYSDKELYRSVSMKINPGEHCCLVGVNGSGKTTLLSMIVGDIYPDQGRVIWENGVSFSYLDQQLKVANDMPVSAYLYGVYDDLFKKEKAMEALYQKAADNPDEFESILTKATRIQDELDNAGFYALQEKVGRLSDGLGFDKEKMETPLHLLSSGQREKAYLAKMLLEEKDVLIMDEPTNFLDQGQVNWLSSYLKGYPKAFLVVSHDQEFLRAIADVVFVLENQTLTRYKGNYDYFLSQHAIDKAQYEKDYIAQQRYIKKEEVFIAKHIVRATSSRAAKSHRARLSHVERMEAPGKEEGRVHFSFPFTHDVGERPLLVDELEIGYNGKALLSPISFTLLRGKKIAILGQNGVGKTTFLKTILGEIPSISGTYKFLDGTLINYFNQDEKIDLSLSPFAYLHSVYPDLNNTQIRTALGGVGVRKDLAIRPMNELSGGEATKARFAVMSLKKSNFLIFDEPTNHLDQKAKDALFEAIEKFPGAVIMVSHEKDFYDGLVDYELVF
ncbi:MAG: ATP-binding cassette domain-containing protein [Bacilli bacterium]|jgi:ATPase subunit of ABC transporter with duplicated ATPase domains|nr:ATP-binding cassette domain-containing protein [Bacilli bacterium]MCH4228761.1 ATP-binding cassette domain-containing protein [Bacilli bacterium]MCH4278073.1 ATP-binding cassette domain-containing protein [Bacilli bacterium]MCI2055495.1 ATP-binding cassette domain-containing protein [Bacilli bacterium]